MTIKDINLGYLTDDDLRVHDSNIDLELKLDAIQRFLSDTVSNISDDELDEFDYVCELLLGLNDQFFDNFKSMINAKKENNSELIDVLSREGGEILNTFNRYEISDQFILKVCDFRLQSTDQDNILAKGRCLLIYQILKEQLMLRSLLNIRTSKNPNLVTDYADYL